MIKEDLRAEKIYSLKQDENYEKQMRIDIDFAMDNLGIADIHKDIKKLEQSLEDIGWFLDFNDILNYLKEI